MVEVTGTEQTRSDSGHDLSPDPSPSALPTRASYLSSTTKHKSLRSTDRRKRSAAVCYNCVPQRTAFQRGLRRPVIDPSGSGQAPAASGTTTYQGGIQLPLVDVIGWLCACNRSWLNCEPQQRPPQVSERAVYLRQKGALYASQRGAHYRCWPLRPVDLHAPSRAGDRPSHRRPPDGYLAYPHAGRNVPEIRALRLGYVVSSGRVRSRGLPRSERIEGIERGMPLPLEQFLDYTDWYIKQLVPDVSDVTVTEIKAVNGGFRVAFADAEPVAARSVVLATGVLPHFTSQPNCRVCRPSWSHIPPITTGSTSSEVAA